MVSQTTCRLWPGTIWGEIVPALALVYRLRRLLVGASVSKVRNRHEDGESGMPMPDSVVLAVLARLGHRQRTLEPVVAIGVVAQPLRRRWQPARGERAGDGRFAPAYGGVARTGAGGDFFTRHRARVAGAVAVAPAHEINVHVIIVIDV